MCLTVTFHIPGPLRDLLLVALSSKVVCYATEVVRQDTTSCARTMDEVDWSQSGSTCVRIDRRVAEILARKGGFIIAGTNGE